MSHENPTKAAAATTFRQRRRRHPVLGVHGAASVLALAMLTVFVVVLSPAPARAAANNLLLSSDGLHYSEHITGPIFSALGGYVPGASSTARIWVRNDSADATTLSVAAVSGPGDAELARNLGLQMQSGSLKSANMALAAPGECRQVMSGWRLLPGHAIELDMVLALQLAATNDTRSQKANFDVVFMLQDATAGGPALNACTGAGTRVPGLRSAGAAGTGTAVGRGVAAVVKTQGTGGVGAAAAGAAMDRVAEPKDGVPRGELSAPTFESASAHSNVIVNNPFWAVLVVLATPAFYLISAVRRRRKNA
ncbi:hypothetical protein [Arthrobacter sp. H14-L1]|uniref:hypothetical protein n=1 Tax=Arthrobacter sp. H14-L1 TaxID=2996697 RepID=UPI00226F68FC|nr:hypothetical protein [Arthrobacter sp. H14-L1]MCY0905692.1 hypothetical protein [Arthrobacter sp. H14-L1]